MALPRHHHLIGGSPMVFALLVATLAQPTVAPAQIDTSVVVTPGLRYRANALHRFFLGETHRRLWATQLTIPVLDLDRFGGLTAFERGGSKQSRALRFRSGDGRIFTFRALDKDPTQTWPTALRSSPARRFAEDLISAILPTGALAVSMLERAAGLLQVGVELVALPNDLRLGEWRAEFAGNPGLLEQRVRGVNNEPETLGGAREVISSEAVFARLMADGRDRVDQAAYLTARLVDFLVGDWDRHADQWSWGRFDAADGVRWVPIPRDRDWAMSRLDGPLYGLLRLYLPKYQSFRRQYGSIYGLSLSAEALDRRLLGGLDRSQWDSVVASLQRRLTDGVIAAAVAALPSEFPAAEVEALGVALRDRRDRLPEAAGRFYRQLAGQVELRGSDGEDLLIVDPAPNGIRVRLGAAGAPRVDRVFASAETREVRVYLGGAGDSVRVGARSSDGIRLRIIDLGEPVVVEGPLSDIGRIYRPPPNAPLAAPADPRAMRRDWGSLRGFAPWFESRPEIGTLIGGGPVWYRYGFDKSPYAARLAVRAAYATGAAGLNADVNLDLRARNPRRRFLLRAAALRTDVVRYFGVGNETGRSADDDFYNVREQRYLAAGTSQWRIGTYGALELGGFLQSSRSDFSEPSLLAVERPYGSGDFTEVGLRGAAVVDSRDQIAYPTRGVRLEVGGRMVPAVFDVERSFAVVEAKAAGYLTATRLPLTPTLAIRATASKEIGEAPFFEKPSLGGRGSVRGLNSRRFLGDGALSGSIEARLDVGAFTLILPGEFGVHALGDVGRVFQAGVPSRQWHTAVGGGLWFAFLDRKSTMTLTYASSRERGRVYLQAGWHF